MLPTEFSDLLCRVFNTGGGFIMDEGDNLSASLELRFELLEVNGRTPIRPDLVRLPVALAYLVEPLPELTIDDTCDVLVSSYSCNRGFHPGSTRPADDKKVVFSPKRSLEDTYAVGVNSAEFGTAVINCLTHHCIPDPFRHRYWPRQHQEKFFFHVDLLIVYLNKNNICLDGSYG